jgi:hypothetical protein
MLPAQRLDVITPTTPVSMLIPRLAHLATSTQSLPLPVVHEGRLLGLIDPEELLAILELEDEFGLFDRGTALDTATAPLVDTHTKTAQPAVNRLPS